MPTLFLTIAKSTADIKAKDIETFTLDDGGIWGAQKDVSNCLRNGALSVVIVAAYEDGQRLQVQGYQRANSCGGRD